METKEAIILAKKDLKGTRYEDDEGRLNHLIRYYKGLPKIPKD